MKTAIQNIIDTLSQNPNEFISKENTIILLTMGLYDEKQQIFDAVDAMVNPLIANDIIVSQINFIGTPGEKYFNQTFNTKDK